MKEIIAENLVVINQNLVNESEFRQIAGNDFRPEVIARAYVKGDHTNQSDTNKGAANAKTFEAIGAYDGYALMLVECGRFNLAPLV